jgi:hypothetical protein
MKKLFLLTTFSALLFSTTFVNAQDEDKSKRPSPPAKVTQTINGDAVISVDYSQPSLKGRTMGKDVEPMKDQVWRAGANEATIFEVSKKVSVEGQALPAGKYGLYMLSGDTEWTVIFNKTSTNWGADGYKEADDALRVKVKPAESATAHEKLTYTISKEGKVSLLWGTLDISFMVK